MPLIVIMWVTTLPQSISIGRLGRPSIAIRPPWLRLAIMSGSADGCPLISSATSKPSTMPSRRCADGDRLARHVQREVDAHLAGQVEPVRR